MRVIVHIGERVDPAAARVLWRLLFGPSAAPPPEEPPDSDPDEPGRLSQAGS